MRFFVGFLITIGLIVLVIVLLVRGGGGTATPSPKALNLASYSTSSSVASLILDSPIVADSQHKEIQIDVTQDQVTYTEYQGYEQNPTETQVFSNNGRSYGVFLRALQHAGYTLGSTDKTLQDERGYCPSGFRYIYSFDNADKQLLRLWSTSCGNDGNFKGLPTTVRTLFQNQVPGYAKLSSNFYQSTSN